MSKIKHIERGCFVTLLALVAVVVFTPASVQAGLRWCYIEHPDAVFCDDFDRYCVEPPVDPNEACTDCDATYAHDVWVPIECGARIVTARGESCEGQYVTSEPFGGKYPKGEQGHHNVNLKSYANEKFGGQINAVKATDQNPLVLEFILNGQGLYKIEHANTFIELAVNDEVNFIEHRAPTDYIRDAKCVNFERGVDYYHPMICQQDVPPAGCPDIATAPHHGSIAVGAMAYLDKIPCDAPTYLPYNKHLSVFDGYKWWTLPASFVGEGTFELGPGENRIRLTLWETTMKVELTNAAQEYSWCDMPRDYQGAFNKMSLGFGKSCMIDLGTWECANNEVGYRTYQCIPTVMYKLGHLAHVGPIYDNVALYGGEGHELPVAPGSCCLLNGTCIDSLSQYECETFSGGTWNGMATTCAESLCCPEPFADADGDGDVDHQDFGMFQACFTGPGPVATPPAGKCTCFDRSLYAEGDGDVDDLDFVDFEACWSGPTIPVDPTCDDALHM